MEQTPSLRYRNVFAQLESSFMSSSKYTLKSNNSSNLYYYRLVLYDFELDVKGLISMCSFLLTSLTFCVCIVYSFLCIIVPVTVHNKSSQNSIA